MFVVVVAVCSCALVFALPAAVWQDIGCCLYTPTSVAACTRSLLYRGVLACKAPYYIQNFTNSWQHALEWAAKQQQVPLRTEGNHNRKTVGVASRCTQ